MKQALMKAFVAFTLLVAGSALPANAQFGSLKGLANKAKKAVKEKVNDTKNGAKGSLKEGSVNEVAGTNGGNESRGASSSSSAAAAEPKKNIHMWVSERDYRRAKHVD